MDCVWTITTSNGLNIKLSVIDADIEADGCRYDEVAVFNESTTSASLLGRFCGTDKPSFVSSGNTITVTFKTDGSNVKTGFKMSYKSENFTRLCGPASLRAGDVIRYLTSPDYPNNYENNLRCVWTITTNSGLNIKLNVIDADLEADGCQYDEVTVYNGSTTSAPLLGRFCGTDKPSFVSSGNSVTVVFKTDSSDVSRGFKMSFKSENFTAICGPMYLQANDAPQFLTSPEYPDNYADNLYCVWIITTRSGLNIKLSVTDADIEGNGCHHDEVAVYNGSTTSAPLLGTFCGMNKPSYLSSGNTVTIRFKTDDSVVRRGFRMSYKSENFTALCGPVSLRAYDAIQYLTSPDYPNNYENNLRCVWTITTNSSLNIKLNVIDADLEADGCQYDEVTVYNGSTTSSPLLGRFCGTDKPSFVSSGNSVTVVFKTDSSDVSRGFKMSFKSEDFTAICGPMYLQANDAPQFLTSPEYPDNYEDNLYCVWIITTRSGLSIKLSVTDADIEGNGCHHDEVAVYNEKRHYTSGEFFFWYWYLNTDLKNVFTFTLTSGSTTSAPLLGTFCGMNKPSYLSSGNTVTIRFKTDDSVVRRGFRMSYKSENFTALCGPVSLRAYDAIQYLTSPDYPNNYENNLRCVWTITSNSGLNIKLNVIDADLEADGCQYDEVTVYNGSTTSAPLLGKFCGTDKPSFVSSGNSVTVVFKTDSSDLLGASKCHLNQKTSLVLLDFFPCSCISNCSRHNVEVCLWGDNINEPMCGPTSLQTYDVVQYLTSPNYPNNYENNLDCQWNITTEVGRYIKLIVLDAKIEEDDCHYDKVMIYDGFASDAHLLGMFCGTEKPTYVSKTNNLIVKFTTDGSHVDRGFRMSYQMGNFSDSVGCGNTSLKAKEYERYLTSPGYPQNYANDLYCSWIITANTGYNVNVTVLRTDIEEALGCDKDAVKFYDGDDAKATLLGILCGRRRAHYVSTGNTITVTFKTDGNNVGSGFRLAYESGHFSNTPCGHKEVIALSSTPMEIMLPSYPRAYPNNADCTWTINTKSSDYVVRIVVTDISIHYKYDCNADFLEIFQGDDGYIWNSKSLAKWCGYLSPLSVQSSGQYMFIRFHSDGNIRKDGFRLEYSRKAKSHRFNVGIIMGSVAGGCILLFTAVCLVSYRTKKLCRKPRSEHYDDLRLSPTQQPSRQRMYITVNRDHVTSISPVNTVEPPSYDDVFGHAQEQHTEAPPPYSQDGLVPETNVNNPTCMMACGEIDGVGVSAAGGKEATQNIPNGENIDDTEKGATDAKDGKDNENKESDDEEIMGENDEDGAPVDVSDTEPILPMKKRK